MSYSFIDAINSSRTLDGKTLSENGYDYKTYLRFMDKNQNTVGNGPSPGPFMIGGIKAYPYSVKSVVLIGIKTVNSKLVPSVFHVDPRTWMSTSMSADSDLDNAKYIREANPASNYPWETVQIAGTKITHANLKTLNPALNGTSVNPINGATFWSPHNKSFISWTYNDGVTAGYFTGSDMSTTSTIYDKGISPATSLVYMNSIVEEMQLRYGFVTPDPLRPYSPANWLKASNNFDKSNAIVFPNFGAFTDQWFYYKILYLPEFDYLMHRDIYTNYRLMTTAFVASEPFKQMIISLGKLTNRNNAMNVGSSQFGYWNTRHQTNLAINESIVPGQYVYGSDYSSKLFLHQDGRVIIYKFPIESDTPDGAVSHDLSKSALQLSSVQFQRDLPFNCTLFMQKDKNIVIYANGRLPYDYSKRPAADSPMYVFENIISMGFKAIASTRTNPGNSNAKKGLSDSTFYALVIYPKGTGASIMCDVKGGQDNLNYDHAADTRNFMLTDSRYNEDCINHWAFKGTKILDATTLGETNNKQWCYTSWTSPSDAAFTVDNNNFIISRNANIQYEIHTFGSYPDGIRNIIRNILYNSLFITYATNALGFMKTSAVNEFNQYNPFSTTNVGYCFKGKRLLNDGSCKMDELLKFNPELKPFFRDKIVNSLCINGETNALCDFLTPNSQVLKDLFAINPRYAEIVLSTKAYYDASTTGLIQPKTDAEKAALFKSIFVTGRLSREMMEIIYGPISVDVEALSIWKNEYKSIFTKLFPTKQIESSLINFKDLSTVYSKLLSKLDTTIVIWKSDLGITVCAGEIDVPYTMSTGINTQELYMKIIYNARYFKNFSNGSKSATMSRVASTKDMALSVFTTGEINIISNTVYDYTVLSGGTADIHIFFKSLNKDKVLNALKTFDWKNVGFLTDADVFENVCKTVPEVCSNKWSDYITTKTYDATTDGICDKVLSSITGNNNDLTKFEKNTAQSLLPLCTISNARTTCSAATSRYKKDTFAVRPSRKTIFESFATDSCGTICTTTNDTQLMAACELGSINYCTQNPNTQFCADDAKRYPSVMNIMKTYCPTNPSSEFCKNIEYTPMPVTLSSSTSAAVSTTNGTAAGTTTGVLTTSVVKSDSSGNLYVSTQPIVTANPSPIKASPPSSTVRFTQSGGTYSLSGVNLLSQDTKYNNDGYKATLTVQPGTIITIFVDGTDLIVSPKISGAMYDTYVIINSKWEEPGVTTARPANEAAVTVAASTTTAAASSTQNDPVLKETDYTATYVLIGLGVGVAVALTAYWYRRRAKLRQANNDITKNRDNIPRHSTRSNNVQQYTSSHPMSRNPDMQSSVQQYTPSRPMSRIPDISAPVQQSVRMMGRMGDMNKQVNSMFRQKRNATFSSPSSE